MQPRWPSGVDGRGIRLAGAVYEFAARLLALSLTVLVVGTFGQVAMDQFAWQCHPAVAKRLCGDQAGEALAGLPGPQWGLALAALVPAAVVFVLLRMARDAKQEYLPVLPTVSADDAEAARRDRRDRPVHGDLGDGTGRGAGGPDRPTARSRTEAAAAPPGTTCPAPSES